VSINTTSKQKPISKEPTNKQNDTSIGCHNPMWSTHGDVNTNAKLRTTPEDVVKAQWMQSLIATSAKTAPKTNSRPRSEQLQRRWIQSAP
jgi:hypothetical protein